MTHTYGTDERIQSLASDLQRYLQQQPIRVDKQINPPGQGYTGYATGNQPLAQVYHDIGAGQGYNAGYNYQPHAGHEKPRESNRAGKDTEKSLRMGLRNGYNHIIDRVASEADIINTVAFSCFVLSSMYFGFVLVYYLTK